MRRVALVGYLLFGVLGGLGLDLCAKGSADELFARAVRISAQPDRPGYLHSARRQFGGVRSLMTARWPWHLLRTFAGNGRNVRLSFTALSRMPLVDALTLLGLRRR